MKVFPPPRAVEVYNPVLRTFHWLMALLIFIALGLGMWSTQLPRGDLRSEVLFVHKSIGITVLALLVVRVVLRVVLGAPAYSVPLGRAVHAAAGAAHLALYALMIALPVSGYMLSNAGKHEVSWFGLFTLPNFVAAGQGVSPRRPARRISFSPARSAWFSRCIWSRSSGTRGSSATKCSRGCGRASSRERFRPDRGAVSHGDDGHAIIRLRHSPARRPPPWRKV